MEDEYWAQRQREWDAWRAEEHDKWEIQKRKEAHRRARDDVKRGRWEITEPLTTDEENELHNLKDYDRWEEVTTDGQKPKWRLKYQNDQQRYDELSNKDQAYKGNAKFA